MFVRSLGTLLLLAAPALAQKLTWVLPDACFVRYERERTRFEFRGDHRILRLGPDPAPGFYAHDVVDGGRIAVPSPSIVDLPALLALSLNGERPRRTDKQRRAFDHVQKFGRVEARGRLVTESDEEPQRIVQKGEFELIGVDAEMEGLRRDLWDLRRLQGELELRGTTLRFSRIVDAALGRVVEFDFELEGELVPRERRDDESERRAFRVAERWRLAAVLEPGYDGFRSEVNSAIARAQSHLITKLDAWLEGPEMAKGADAAGNTYGTGRLALVLLAIQKGDPDLSRERVQRAFEELRRREPRDTYSLANAILALETLYESANEIQQLRDGLLERPARRYPNDSDAALLGEWTRRLLANQDTRVDPGYLLRFHYTPNPNYDNSNTQYAALGLQAAARCGIEVSPTVWTSLAAHWLDEQREPESKPRPVRLVTYRELRERKGGGTSLRRGRRSEARGFGYRLDSHPYGSMTCAGITGIQVCLGMLQQGRLVPRKLIHELETARYAAFAWLLENWNVRNNPRRHRDHFYYWLYSLERSCELGQIAEVHGHDWYFEGAMQLLGTQGTDGAWGNAEDTAFGLLFLKKASVPAVTGR